MSGGLDWDAIRAKYEARVQAEVEAGLDPVEARRVQPVVLKTKPKRHTAPAVPKREPDGELIRRMYTEGRSIKSIAAELHHSTQTVSRVLGNLKGASRHNGWAVDDKGNRVSPYAHLKDEWTRLYLSGVRISDIAEQFGTHRRTVQSLLGEVYDPSRDKGGPKPKTHCKRGHDLSVHGAQRSAGDGRWCRTCRRMKQREAMARARGKA